MNPEQAQALERIPSPSQPAGIAPERGVFCNRALNLRSVRAIGYDMDYTLIHYHVDAWEHCAYRHLRDRLAELGWPVAELEFDPQAVIRGLIIDRDLGNLVKANQFGYVKLAAHGTRMLDFDAQRQAYADTLVDLADSRWVFLNTLFSLSEASMYAQLVDLLDGGRLPPGLGYGELYEKVRQHLDAAHLEGQLKADIIADPERFVALDPETPLALLDQRAAGKRVILITNSEWSYSQAMMSYAFDRFLPAGMGWRDLFDLVIVGARKPAFFWESMPLFQVLDAEGRLMPVRATPGLRGVFLGGHATLVEEMLGLSGAEILYVGDHMYGDVHASKGVRRWRTALILRELEADRRAMAGFMPDQARLDDLMARKNALELDYSRIRLHCLRLEASPAYTAAPPADPVELRNRMARLREQLVQLDEQIAPLAVASGRLNNPRWGLLLRAGNDKSHLAHQAEGHADIYTSRVANFMAETPFAYFRPPTGRLPHDPPRA